MKALLAEYLAVFPEESARLRTLQEFMDGVTEPKQFFDRKNFAGHITASGFVLSPDRKRLAVVKHKFLNRYLQPGGHVEESDENVYAAALREIREETNLQSCRHLPLHSNLLLPADIDTHEIPANPKKNEARHFHHDFRYVFCVEAEVVPSANGPAECEWVWRPLAEAIAEPTFGIVLRKLARLGN